ncbi:hypothetical protein EDD16DRAFT_1703786 [Pisolithus croceorrhizus]|nr:hypothetical protein EDD16DRAFT_1703786 [Pisolithus croceorrhizus]KAI6168476.1 hypothetical protein EDD17DRAFT_1749983 [Pisolithus thermaeus]
MAATRIACRSRALYVHAWPSIIAGCRTYSTALAQQPKPKPSTSSRSKAAPVQSKSKESAPKKSKTSADDLEDELKALDRMRRIPTIYPSTDIWGSPMASFDVQIPYDIQLMWNGTGVQRPFKVKDFVFALKHNVNNWLKNTFSMFTIARANAFPGLKNVQLRFRPSVWRKLRNVQSCDPSSWLGPLRKIALETYRQTHVAIARQNEDVIKSLTVGEFQSKALHLIRRREKGHKWFWDITSDTSDLTLYAPDPTFMTRLRSFATRVLRRNSSEQTHTVPPVTIVSIRAAEIYLAEQDPKVGHRLVIQALAKFDTTQVLKITDRHGKLVESELSKPHRVVQYVVLEKIGWYDSPWKLREQIYRT